MIYCGIEIGSFFELRLVKNNDCRPVVVIIRPFLKMTFVFVQMYFIFLNQKVTKYFPLFQDTFSRNLSTLFR